MPSRSNFPTSARQRCVVHKMDNVLSYIPNKQQEQIKPELKALFYQKDRQVADQAVAAFMKSTDPSIRWRSRVCSAIWRPV